MSKIRMKESLKVLISLEEPLNVLGQSKARSLQRLKQVWKNVEKT